MTEPEQGPPQVFGIDHAIHKLQKHLDHTLAHLRGQITDGFARLERIETFIMAQIDDMNAKLTNIANTETQLGTDIQTVVDALKGAQPGTDLTAQLAQLDQIAQKLIDTDATTLANLPPAPPPAPGRGRR